jgi:predicted house-cleaning noncanonical NTP pyrophosphatase (MazG superfamily)
MAKLKFAFNKLVRDTAVEKMQNEGITVDFIQLHKDELLMHLKNKLIEETHEVVEAVSNCELGEELADVIDIIEAICNIANINDENIEKNRKKKFKERGGFKSGIFVYSIEVDSTNKIVKYFLNLPKKYPLTH